MSKITIKNEKLSACISTLGAQLLSLNDGKNEYMWQADENVWNFTAPVLFPICGRLNDDSYSFQGKEYKLPTHGFARFKEFTIESHGKNNACFLLKSDDDTMQVYPFEFEFRVMFEITEKKLNITYNVTNPSKEKLYFSFGGHEGYACAEGVDNYFIEFENDNYLTRHMLSDNFFCSQTEEITLDNGRLMLDYKEFEKCTYIFRNINSKSVILSDKNEKRKIKIGFDGYNTLALWTLPYRKYVCIEPWCGVPQSIDFNGDLTQKDGIIELLPEKTFSRTHYIEIL